LKKVYKILIWVLAGIIIVLIIGFVSIKRDEALCTKITVKILDSTGLNLLSEKEFAKIIDSVGGKIINKPVKEINISKIEKKIRNFYSVKQAEIYINIDGELIAEIVPRIPIIRICNKKNQNYYIDKEGYVMPLMGNKAIRLLVANGNISHKPRFDTTFNIYNRRYDKRTDIKTLRDIHILTRYIKSDPFWDAQVQEIFINNEDDIEISTLVGDQMVILGSIDNYEEKFRNLEAFYKKGLPTAGWGTYKEINLKFKNQVVCTKQ
jgi:cell division protein FtsQ